MIDVELLGEMWLIAKEYIPAKDRGAAADHIVAVVAEGGITEEQLKEFGGTDPYLGRGVHDYLGEEEVDDDDDVDYGSDDY